MDVVPGVPPWMRKRVGLTAATAKPCSWPLCDPGSLPFTHFHAFMAAASCVDGDSEKVDGDDSDGRKKVVGKKKPQCEKANNCRKKKRAKDEEGKKKKEEGKRRSQEMA